MSAEDYNKFVDITPFAAIADSCILLANEDALCCHHNQGAFVKRKSITIPVVADL